MELLNYLFGGAVAVVVAAASVSRRRRSARAPSRDGHASGRTTRGTPGGGSR